MNRIEFPAATVNSRRFTYVAFLGITLCATPTTIRIVIFGFRHYQALPLLLLSLLLSAVLTFCLAALGARLFFPPRLSVDQNGLTLRIGTRTEHWQWPQIDAFHVVRAPRDHFVVIDWKPSPAAEMRTRRLDYPFKKEALDLRKMLQDRLVQAREFEQEREPIRTAA
ncbi:MAG: hypothetical protein ACTHJR_09800 [Sphingomonas sp.]|uniref:hypothetical protein n=1 Tax=Sphingomonas sp. TaxID=28214 RepID=UPI003F7FE1C4